MTNPAWARTATEVDPDSPEGQRAAARQAREAARGNKSRAAKALGVMRKTLYAWLKPDSAEG